MPITKLRTGELLRPCTSLPPLDLRLALLRSSRGDGESSVKDLLCFIYGEGLLKDCTSTSSRAPTETRRGVSPVMVTLLSVAMERCDTWRCVLRER